MKHFNIKSDTLNLIQHKIRKKYIELAVTERDFVYNMNSTGAENKNTFTGHHETDRGHNYSEKPEHYII